MEDSPAVARTYHFDPFAQHPFYTQINHSLVLRALARLDAVRPLGEASPGPIMSVRSRRHAIQSRGEPLE